jgi:hypothetical protein
VPATVTTKPQAAGCTQRAVLGPANGLWRASRNRDPAPGASPVEKPSESAGGDEPAGRDESSSSQKLPSRSAHSRPRSSAAQPRLGGAPAGSPPATAARAATAARRGDLKADAKTHKARRSAGRVAESAHVWPHARASAAVGPGGRPPAATHGTGGDARRGGRRMARGATYGATARGRRAARGATYGAGHGAGGEPSRGEAVAPRAQNAE